MNINILENITLVLTAHRREHLIEALMSVAAQDDKNFDFIVCLDTNNDTGLNAYIYSIFKCISCSSKQVFEISGNGTAGYVRNYAFSKARSDWVGYLDGDDMIAPNAISLMKKFISSNNNIDIFSSGMIRITTEGEAKMLVNSLSYYPPIDIYCVDPDTIGQPTFFNQFQIMKKKCWEDYPYDESTNGEDIDFMLHQLLKNRFFKIPKYLYYYREVNNSFSKKVYEKGDLTTKRYLEGYYKRLFEIEYSDRVSENFKFGVK